MKAQILLVEDDKDLLFSENLILELNGYQTITALNGQDALKKLKGATFPPDLILSDIMMPELNGYDLFLSVSQYPEWKQIPFIFLSAKSDPDDIRFAKILGADDYLVKPFSEKALINLVKNKLKKRQKAKKVEDDIDESIKVSEVLKVKKNNPTEKTQTRIMVVFWDDSYGPKIKHIYPEPENDNIPYFELADQLYESSVSVYGQNGFFGSTDILLNILNVGMDGYLYFDAYEDRELRAGMQIFMIAVISENIPYLISLKLKEIMKNYTEKIEELSEKHLVRFWNDINEVIS